MKRGVRFQIPNEYGKFIANILEPIDCTHFSWRADFHTEIWKCTDGKLDEELFPNPVVNGDEFYDLINNNIYYMIFATIKAFSKKGSSSIRIDTYKDFIASECEIIMLVADCSYTDVYCKDVLLIEKLYDNAKSKAYEYVEYIYEADSRTSMYA